MRLRSPEISRPFVGFTLVELLVVVTIIVAMLALLAPALDRAMYQAELAVCGAQQAQAAKGLVAYTGENRRLFPYRPTQDPANKERRRPHFIQDALGANGTAINAVHADDRPNLRQAWGTLDVLLDPMSPKVDLDREFTPTANAGPPIIAGSYALWFGFNYLPPNGGGRGIYRLGDRLEWIDISRGSPVQIRSGFLISDWDMPMPIYETNGGAHQKVITSHPDYEDKLYTQRGENISFIYSWWTWGLAAGSSHRPPVDLNFATMDASVARSTAIEWNDDRMARMPYAATSAATSTNEIDGAWNHLPRQ